MADNAALAERVRILLEEFGEFIDAIEAETVAAWKQGLTLRRKFDHVLRTDTLERLQHERQARR